MCEFKKKISYKKRKFLGHSDIAPLRKIDPGEKFPWKKLSNFKIGVWYEKKPLKFVRSIENKEKSFLKISKNWAINILKSIRDLNDKKIIKSFQQHYSPKNVTGKLDKKTYIISHFLTH